MFRFINALLVLGLIFASFLTYRLEHATRSGEREVAKLQTRIREEQESYRLLTAEWSLLTRPDRLQHLAQKYLKLGIINPGQVISAGDLEMHLPPEPLIVPNPHAADPIGDVLEQLNQAQP
jgi:cell division protein FtsL